LRLQALQGGVVSPLARASALAEITKLDLSGNDLDDRSAEILGRSRSLGRLRSLDLSNNRLSDAGLWAVASPQTAKTCLLFLRNNSIRLPSLSHDSLLPDDPLFSRTDLHGNPFVPVALRRVREQQDRMLWHQPGRPPRLFNSIGMQFATAGDGPA